MMRWLNKPKAYWAVFVFKAKNSAIMERKSHENQLPISHSMLR